MTTTDYRPELSILIVNWNAVTYLRPCLTSIFQHVRDIDFEVVVIDNASFDGVAELIAREFPTVKFIQSETNLGFAKANNLAFHRSRGEFVLLLNPDTEMTDDSVMTMLSHIKANPRAGATGCCLLNSDLTLQWRYVQAFPTITNQFLGADLLHRLFPRSKLFGMRPLFDYRDQALDVEVLAGSCILVRRTVFEEIGGFSDRYYMYAEDVELCYRIHEAGHAVQYIGSKKIIHHGGTSSAFRQESEFSTVMQKESLFKFFEVTRGRWYAWLYKGSTAVAAIGRVVLICCMIPLTAMWVVDRRQLIAGAQKWLRVLRWATGREHWVATVGQ